jgi:hypothetical protein
MAEKSAGGEALQMPSVDTVFFALLFAAIAILGKKFAVGAPVFP